METDTHTVAAQILDRQELVPDDRHIFHRASENRMKGAVGLVFVN